MSNRSTYPTSQELPIVQRAIAIEDAALNIW